MSLVSMDVQDAGVKAALQAVARRAGSPEPVLRHNGELILLHLDQGFENETDPYGVPWQPNAPFTISQKTARGQIQKVLQATGRGRDSINYRIVGGNTLIVGTPVGYMADHQLGRGVPKREFLFTAERGLPEPVRDEFLRSTGNYVATGRF